MPTLAGQQQAAFDQPFQGVSLRFQGTSLCCLFMYRPASYSKTPKQDATLKARGRELGQESGWETISFPKKAVILSEAQFKERRSS
jgi:hypothetical protein